MKEFNFKSPTEIVFGPQSEEEVGRLLTKYGAKSILIVIGKNSVVKSGLLNRVLKSIEKENITYELLSGVRANPTFELVKQGNQLVVDHSLDFILAIGGGSVIDTAKCIGVTAYYEGEITDFNFHVASPKTCLPIGVILTIAAAGSELSSSCVIQDDESGIKSGFNSDLVRPVFAIENPELTYSVSKEQTAYGIVDILMHTLERYFCPSEDYELADEFALGLLKNVIEAGSVAFNNPNDYDSRAALMLASSLSHNGITSIGKKYWMPVHQLEHALSGKFIKVAHACGLAILFPGWAQKYYVYDTPKFARLARHVFGIHLDSEEEEAKACLVAFKEYFKSLDMPTKLSEVGVKEKDIEILADIVTKEGSREIPHHSLPLGKEVAKEIYLMVL